MADRDNLFSIDFFIVRNGETIRWASRGMKGVPRVGDEIMLGAGKDGWFKADKFNKTPFRVLKVVWGVEAADYRNRISTVDYVNIELEALEPNVPMTAEG